MTDFYASLSGVRVVSGVVTLPYYGLASGDLVLATEDEVPASCTLRVGNLALAGTVYRQAAFAGSRSVRFVAGAGGWRRVVSPRAYRDPGGVALSMVLRDLAAEVGESIAITADRTIGTAFVREAAPAARILRQLVGREWWIDAAGVTRFGARASAEVRSDYQVEVRDGAGGRFVISTEDLASWAPGAAFFNPIVAGAQTIASVSIVMASSGKLRLDVLAGGPDRLERGENEIIRGELPWLTFQGLWEYSVESATETTFSGRPTSDVPLPDLVDVELRPSISGMKVRPAPGTRVLVAFVNADPTRPVVVGGDTTVPPEVDIDGDSIRLGAGLGRVLREGDTLTLSGVQAGPGTTGVQATITLGLGLPPAPSKVLA